MTTALHSADFHAHHSAMGAWMSFTCGRHGAGGGLTIQGAKPATHDLIIGVVDQEGQRVRCLPLRKEPVSAPSMAAFGDTGTTPGRGWATVETVAASRDYQRGTDTWSHEALRFTIFTPHAGLPDPQRAGEAALAAAVLPAIAAQLRYDNRAGTSAITLFFACTPGTNCYIINAGERMTAVGWGREFAFAARHQTGLEPILEWTVEEWLKYRRPNHLGSMCGLALTVPAGQIGTLDLALCTYRAGAVTSGIDAAFWYTRRYPNLISVIADTLDRHGELAAAAEALDRDPRWLALDDHRRFLVAHSERSYWGNTWLLDHGGQPRWVVLEGEYAMHNTFDLTVDMAFYEAARQPWTLRNVLDQFCDHYAFVDTVARPAADARRFGTHTFNRDPAQIGAMVTAPTEGGLAGGISFCHDMGVGGFFTPDGTSSYECSGLAGCFSHMTAEQLANWCLTAAIYVAASGDRAWVRTRLVVVRGCLESLLNRDDPVAERRNGIPGLDSERCAGGWEITTYDSLDPSLGQARDNLYMTVKWWAAALALQQLLLAVGDSAAAAIARASAVRSAAAVAVRCDLQLGFIPAVFDGHSVSAIIPAVEGLVYPLAWGDAAAVAADGPFAPMIATLRRHLIAVLKPGVCLFPDHGWKLSSTSDNSWLSKIFLAQVVAERAFALIPDPASHAAHAQWQQIGSAEWAMTDQCNAGKHCGSRYYPRCVSADLWLNPVIRSGRFAANP